MSGQTKTRSWEGAWQEALRRIESAKESESAELDLSDLQLTAIPDSLVQLASLERLDLSENQLTAVPDPLGQLANLQRLDLGRNLITAIPDSLGQLANLGNFRIFSNRITAIPDSIAKLAALETLTIFSNRITAIPDSIPKLASLQNLGLFGNGITAIPDSLAQLANLERLDLGNNEITAIPDSLAKLTNLKRLYLNRNQITAIPNSLNGLSGLTHLFLHENPGLGVPDEILGPTWYDVDGEKSLPPKPPQEILAYYFAQRTDSRPLNEAKLILVGQGGVGKTSLVKALSTGKFNSRERTTEGIKISDWSCPLSRKDAVTLHIWDFGGQEMMHATHQFFLTARSLYLLVLNRRPGGYDREADYWFRLIRAFGGKDAPVLVVLNKQRSEPFDVNRGAWLERYAENIRGFVETDCSSASTVTQLKRKIQLQIRQLKNVKVNFPRRWFAIKDELTAMPADYVTFEVYREICRKHGEGDPEHQALLAGFLHDLGIALNYRQDPRLRFAYVLKPEWVTQGIYAILHAFVRSKGLFSRAQTEEVLAQRGYPREAGDFIMALMEQFELSFPLADRENRILIPELLEDRQPDLARDFQFVECLNFGYQYTVVPEGLLPRFIVRTHHLSKPESRWKSGVILHHDSTGCRGLVRADATENQVRIHVDGPDQSRRELLAIIRHNFDTIHSDYEFKPVDLVYPPGVPDRPLRVDDLQDLQRSGDQTVRVVRPDRTVIQPDIASLVAPIQTPAPLRLFLSYSHQDEKHLNELRKDLKLMERNGLIRPWYDRALTAGEKWEPRILQELNEADVIVCQLSRDFLASDFCVLTELDNAIRRKEAGEAELIAYVLKDCGWKEVPKLQQFLLLPKDAKPLIDWKDKDKYWRAVAGGIQTSLEGLQARRPKRAFADRSVDSPLGVMKLTGSR